MDDILCRLRCSKDSHTSPLVVSTRLICLVHLTNIVDNALALSLRAFLALWYINLLATYCHSTNPKMRSLWFSFLAFLPSLVYAEGQIPVVNGVIGGVGPLTETVKPTLLKAVATTPGKLRFKENSGVCGNQCFL